MHGMYVSWPMPTAQSLIHTAHPVVDLLQSKEIEAMGHHAFGVTLPYREDSLAHKVYEQDLIYERHRHRYEFNKYYRNILESHGMTFSGFSPDNRLMEVVELRDHPWFLGCMFHPGYKSRPQDPTHCLKGLCRLPLKKERVFIVNLDGDSSDTALRTKEEGHEFQN